MRVFMYRHFLFAALICGSVIAWSYFYDIAPFREALNNQKESRVKLDKQMQSLSLKPTGKVQPKQNVHIDYFNVILQVVEMNHFDVQAASEVSFAKTLNKGRRILHLSLAGNAAELVKLLVSFKQLNFPVLLNKFEIHVLKDSQLSLKIELLVYLKSQLIRSDFILDKNNVSGFFSSGSQELFILKEEKNAFDVLAYPVYQQRLLGFLSQNGKKMKVVRLPDGGMGLLSIYN